MFAAAPPRDSNPSLIPVPTPTMDVITVEGGALMPMSHSLFSIANIKTTTSADISGDDSAGAEVGGSGNDVEMEGTVV